ncbi:hypothetical protein NL676_032178 [Syzygium grande]|nr:hypothetical protein NL676_032178 [Syzygium grande]
MRKPTAAASGCARTGTENKEVTVRCTENHGEHTRFYNDGMYVTRPLSMYRKRPEALSKAPPAGPGSGYLAIQDEEAQNFSCFGLCKDRELYDFPSLRTRTSLSVVGQPLSSNQYYVIRRRGKHKGEAHANSTEEDKGTYSCFRYVRDKKPSPLDPDDIHQQFVIYRREIMCLFGGFHAVRCPRWVPSEIPEEERLDPPWQNAQEFLLGR